MHNSLLKWIRQKWLRGNHFPPDTQAQVTELRNSTTELKKEKEPCLTLEFSPQTFEDHLLGCSAMQWGRYALTFQRNLLIHQTRWWKQQYPLKCLYTSARLNGVTSQKTGTFKSISTCTATTYAEMKTNPQLLWIRHPQNIIYCKVWIEQTSSGIDQYYLKTHHCHLWVRHSGIIEWKLWM